MYYKNYFLLNACQLKKKNIYIYICCIYIYIERERERILIFLPLNDESNFRIIINIRLLSEYYPTPKRCPQFSHINLSVFSFTNNKSVH